MAMMKGALWTVQRRDIVIFCEISRGNQAGLFMPSAVSHNLSDL